MRPFLLAVLIFMTACTTSSNRYERLRRGASARLEQSRSPAELPPTRGLEQLDQTPLFEDREELDPEEYVAKVLERNPTLAAARATVEAAIARYPQVTALQDPVLGYALAPTSIGSSSVDFAQRIELSQRFPWPGKLELRGEMAASEAEASRGDLRTARDRLVREAKSAFSRFYFVYRAIEINEINKSILLELQRLAEFRYAAGMASKQDALQAEVAYDHLLHRGIVLERMRRIVLGRLNALLNRAPAADLPPPPQALEGPGDREPFEDLLARALSARPELSALYHRLESRQAAVALAQKESYPDFTVMGGYNSLWQQHDLRPIVGVAIDVPIQRGRLRGGLEEAAAELSRLRAQIGELTAQVAQEVQEAYELVVETEHVIQLYRDELIPAAEENLEAARVDYSAGEVDFLSLLSAERSLMDARLAFQEALSSYHQRAAELSWAVGEPPVGQAESALQERGDE